MPRLNVSLTGLGFDGKSFKKALDAEIQKIFLEAAYYFVENVWQEVLQRHVDTGMAAGSLKGSVVRFSGATGTMSGTIGYIFSIVPKPRRSATGHFKARYGYDDSGRRYIKNINSGMSKGLYKFTRTGNKYSFVFQSRVHHYKINEFFEIAHIADTPWSSLVMARHIFNEYLSQQLKTRLPLVGDYIIKTRYTGDGNEVKTQSTRRA